MVNAAGESEMSRSSVTGDCYEATVWDGAVAPTNLTAEGYDDEDGLAGVLWTWEDSNVEDLECGEGVSSYVQIVAVLNSVMMMLNIWAMIVSLDDGTCTDIDSNGSIVSWLGDGACDDGSLGTRFKL